MRRQSGLVDSPPLEPRLSESTTASTDTAAADDTDDDGEPRRGSVTASLPQIREPSLEQSRSAGQPSRGDDSLSRPATPPIQEESTKHRRFSLLKFRNASDSQLSVRARQQAEAPPPLPRPPEIITTAPTLEISNFPQRKASRLRLADRFRKSSDIPRHSEDGNAAKRSSTWKPRRTTGWDDSSRDRLPLVTFEEPRAGPAALDGPAPGTHDVGEPAAVSAPTPRASESSRSDAASTNLSTTNAITPTKHTGPSAASFFRLPRRKPKAPPPLFDLSHLPKGRLADGAENSGVSTSSLAAVNGTSRHQTSSRPPSSYSATAESVASGADAGAGSRPMASPATALFRPGSTHSGHSSPTRAARLQLRGRSSTMSSLGRESLDGYLQPGTTRTSSSMGRKSLGDLLGLSKIRHNSELQMSRQGTFTPATPGSNTSKNNSFQMAREPVVLPEKQEDETAVKYLARIEQTLARGVIASALSKPSDPFFTTVLRSYMRRFSFFGDPMDMSIRKLLMEAELPKETQQIDRCLQAFANRYHECNPGIYSSPDQAYFIAFSLLILHTDVFNKNNKYKMQQADYIKNTHGEGVAESILRCFYDNITYTPFIHVEDDIDLNGDRHRVKRKTLFPGATPEAVQKRPSREPLDPYTLILDGKLDILRPSLKDVMELDDIYNYLGSAKTFNVRELQRTFFRTGVLQIVSARSRPDAFRDENGTSNPDMAPQGVVDIKVTKVGLLWRKDVKKKKTRSPWQEWGAILTGAQLYFFRNTNWVKNLMHQYETHVKQGFYGEPITFKPALADFKPDAFMPVKDAVAIVDSTYKRHKNAFKYSRPSAFVEEVLLADNEDEMNDWLAKLNYAAAFTTSGVRMRGVHGVNYEGQIRRGIRRLDSSNTAQIVQTPSGEVSIVRGKIDKKEADSLLAQRHDAMMRVVAKAAEDISVKEKELEEQLRNARHLQILAPIQAKTREEVLREAARMDVKIKWIRMEMWKIKCHRDVLAQDLEEEGVVGSPSPTKRPPHGSDRVPSSPGKERIFNTDPKSNASVSDQRPTTATSLPQLASSSVQPGPEQQTTTEVQTPPTQKTTATHRHQQSWDSTVSASEALRRARSASYVTGSSETHGTPGSAQLDLMTTPDKSEKQRPASIEGKHSEDVDAHERDLLEQAGLLESPSHQGGSGGRHGSVSEAEDLRDHVGSIEKSDRVKMRRSLQRTLRESAGHLSHHRSKRTKEPSSSGVSEDAGRDDRLSRGSGSFVVHGKKASVIDFGDGLKHMPTEERLRQRMQAQRDEPLSPSSVDEDFYDAVGHQSESKERRESAASGSTATARSFRELHRKYSSVQGTKQPQSSGKLSVPSDTDSDAAVSVSEGRRTPLPPIETHLDEEDDEDFPLPGQSRSQLQSPASPDIVSPTPAAEQHRKQHEDSNRGAEEQRIPSPQTHAITA